MKSKIEKSVDYEITRICSMAATALAAEFERATKELLSSIRAMNKEIDMSSDLAPCPFCGRAAQMRTAPGGKEVHVVCGACGAVGPTCLTIEAAVASWNNRAFTKPYKVILDASGDTFVARDVACGDIVVSQHDSEGHAEVICDELGDLDYAVTKRIYRLFRHIEVLD